MAITYKSESDPNDKKGKGRKSPWGDISWTSGTTGQSDSEAESEPDVPQYEVGQTITCRGTKDGAWAVGTIVKATKNLIIVDIEIEGGKTTTIRIPPAWPFIM